MSALSACLVKCRFFFSFIACSKCVEEGLKINGYKKVILIRHGINLEQCLNLKTTKRKKTDKNKLKVLSKFWKKLGSKVVIMDAKKHDIIFSLTSHLPHLIAYNLIQTATEFEKRKRYNLLNFSAGGLRDFSRIAASNEIMWRDIFFSNKKNISQVIDLFIKNLKSFKRNIRANNNKVIIRKLKDAKKVRQKIIKLKQDINKPDFGRN